MKPSHVALSILLTVIARPLFAAESCQAVFLEPARALEVSEKSLLTSEQYEALLKSVDALLGDLAVPNGVHIKIAEPGVGGLYSRKTNDIIVMSSFLKYPSGKGNHPKYSTAILSHEYGHAIFDKNMRELSPSWNALEIESVTILERSNKATKAYMDAIDTAVRATTPQEKAEAEVVKSKALEEMMAAGKRMSQLLKMRDVSSAYHELFADTVAVVRFQDPRIIFNALSGNALIKDQLKYYQDPKTKEAVKFSEKDLIRINIENRQFDKSWGEAHFQQWLKDINGTIANKSLHPYLLLAPTRAALWDVIRNKVKNPHEQKHILTKLVQVLRKHYEENFKDAEAAQNIDPVKFNQSLISEIQQMYSK
ncbi:hypothetical protein [Bdellovibrio sp. KM01]|uniref:hypothetical protein n=1 Tax=Bdellovibrio sp. KM01 TaxID=2748865 RepID=UPI0015E96B45|nr:hypothetical protein [Bdellovibrio sp. KM01]QLY24058.1 hypothetical protein HW988_11285 [Bdellovibrio sp. KM01]